MLQKLGQVVDNKRSSTSLPQNIENMCHPHIMRVLKDHKPDKIMSDKVDYLIMEHASNGTLRDAYPSPDKPEFTLP